MDIRALWKNHPLYAAGKIELVPTDWVWAYRGADVSPEADLKDGTIVTLDELWDNIVSEGLHDPLIMRVGVRNKKFRLEAGNHRIQVFHTHGVPFIPVTVQVREECGPHVGDVMTDATHNFDAGDDVLISAITEEYMKPSDVFRSLAGVARPA
ncbi:MAG TPA: hypothetical protein PLW99_00775 [Candidatus Paceibacterota bacterium]|nr:MAG: hypothetical protein B7X03_01385 [Parcubacteria group bacterium 21-58-10]OYV83110.1 MAG: hypothetical protein B7W96_00670 [Parcubacteria group bacterium 37-58-5]HQT82666.1 hypothetical protein [Candidatus Paceibacterota bacterium]